MGYDYRFPEQNKESPPAIVDANGSGGSARPSWTKMGGRVRRFTPIAY